MSAFRFGRVSDRVCRSMRPLVSILQNGSEMIASIFPRVPAYKDTITMIYSKDSNYPCPYIIVRVQNGRHVGSYLGEYMASR